jgi:hypothetical protein
MKMLSISKAHVIGASIGIFGICNVSIAGDITEYANKEWVRLGYVWGTTEIVGCQPADPDGNGCAPDTYSVAGDSPPWTFEVGSEGATLTVVDGWLFGEQYAVSDNGTPIGNTSAAPVVGECGGNPDYCLTTDASKGYFELESGMHSITMTETTGIFMTGVLWMRLDGDVVGSEIEVDIDILPNRTNNHVRPDSSGLMSVAILHTEDFDAQQVNPETVQFGPNSATEIHRGDHVKDVDNDGDMDLLFHFRISQTGIQCGDTSATLTGETWDEVSIFGTDSIITRCRN